MSTTLQREIEEQLAECEPDVEVLLAEVVGGGTLRVFIDHPEGVTLALCERVDGGAGPAARALHAGGLLARDRAPPDQARALPPLRRPPRAGTHAWGPARAFPPALFA